MPRVVVDGVGASLEASAGDTLLDVLDRGGVPVDAACGGFAACNTCRVRLLAGELSPVDDVELPFLDREDQRLACQARVVGDVTIRLDPGA
jgi:ferredoxin